MRWMRVLFYEVGSCCPGKRACPPSTVDEDGRVFFDQCKNGTLICKEYF